MSRKIKYDINIKKLVVTEVINKGLSYEKAGHRFGLDKTMVRNWVSFFKEYGLEGLRPIQNRYTPDFKIKVILEMRENSLSFRETCVHFKIPSVGTLTKWVEIYDQQGPKGLLKENRGELNLCLENPKNQ